MESSATGGVKPMAIAGRMVRERERLFEMTNEERAWRKQWLKDQHLAKNEPVHVPEYWKERLNPIRRFYKAPLDAMQKVIAPVVGPGRAFTIRFFTGKFAMLFATGYLTYYMLKYNPNNWTRKGGWRILRARESCNPGDPQFPKLSDKTKMSDYGLREFDKSPI